MASSRGDTFACAMHCTAANAGASRRHLLPLLARYLGAVFALGGLGSQVLLCIQAQHLQDKHLNLCAEELKTGHPNGASGGEERATSERDAHKKSLWSPGG